MIQASALALPLPDASIDLIVTSPPYFMLRTYQDNGQHVVDQVGAEQAPDQYITSLLSATLEMVRVLKPRGSIWVNLGDKYNGYNANRGASKLTPNTHRPTIASGSGLDIKGLPNKSLAGLPWRYALRCIDDLGLTLRAEVIWQKPSARPETVKDRVRRTHEQWFHFTTTDRYYHDKSDNFGSVWSFLPSRAKIPDHLGVEHTATFPENMISRIVDKWSPSGGVVLDPFGGTGTVSHVANGLARQGISCDLSLDYARVAQWRVS